MACLALKGTTRELREGETIVGNGAMATWRVADADLMRKHFVVGLKGTVASIWPAVADSVVAVNGKQLPVDARDLQVDPRELQDGDVVDAGTGRFTYWATEPKAQPESPDLASPSASPDAKRAYLVDSKAGVAYSLARTSTGIGRDLSNTVVVSEPTVSRFQAEIRREAGGYALRAVDSSGTQVNEELMATPRLLSEGDQIRIEKTILRFTREALPANVRKATLPEPLVRGAKSSVETTKLVGVGKGLRDAEEAQRAGLGRSRGKSLAAIVGALVVVLVIIVVFVLRA
jgi:hypothetical protein